jgi:hypothetical protein
VAVAEVAGCCGGGVHGDGECRKGGTVARTWLGPAGRMREGGRAYGEYDIYKYRISNDFGMPSTSKRHLV